MRISILVYANNIVLIDNNRKEIEKTLKWLEKWMNIYKLTINHNKSTYIYNCDETMEPIYVQGKEILKIVKNKSYLYLEIHLNIDLYWEKHARTTKAKFL